MRGLASIFFLLSTTLPNALSLPLDVNVDLVSANVNYDDETGEIHLNIDGEQVSVISPNILRWSNQAGQGASSDDDLSQSNPPPTPGAMKGSDGTVTVWVSKFVQPTPQSIQQPPQSLKSPEILQPEIQEPPKTKQPAQIQQRPQPPSPSPISSAGGDQRAALDFHNQYRQSNLGSDYTEITWDDDLANSAMAYAQTLINNPSWGLKHADSTERAGAGENLWSISAASKDPFRDASQAWTEGEQDAFERYYDPTKGVPCVCGEFSAIEKSYLHYTQAVWKSTLKLGLGQATASDGRQVVVARYSPTGNYKGQGIDGATLVTCPRCG